jgi:hypothetical protein
MRDESMMSMKSEKSASFSPILAIPVLYASNWAERSWGLPFDYNFTGTEI